MPDHLPPRVSTEDLLQILITMAYPAFRYSILTHGAHKVRFHIIALVTDNPDELPDVLAPPGSVLDPHNPVPILTATETICPGPPEPLCRTELPKTSLTSKTASSSHGCPGPSTSRTNERTARARSARPASVTLSRTATPAITAPPFPVSPAPG